MADYTTIDDPSAYFQTMLYVGSAGGSDPADGSTASFTFDGNSDLQPDWMWFKGRNYANDWTSYDSTLGFGSDGDEENGALYPSTSGAEGASNTHASYGYVKSFDTDGFTGESGSIGAVSRAVWGYASQALAYGWKANGGTTSSVTASGSGATRIAASNYQANTTSKFSICTWTGTDDTSGATITHGLGVAPELILVKRRSGTDSWTIYHHKNSTAPETDILILDTNAAGADNDRFNDTAPTSTVFSVNASSSAVNGNGETYVAYCFAGVQGFSKFGSYEGNGQVNGQFINTGFKPAFVLIKNIEATEPWVLFDTKRDPFNLATKKLSPETHETENAVTGQGDAAYNNIDIYSNGFQCRSNNGATNSDDVTYIYITFAEEPLVTSGGVPATAR